PVDPAVTANSPAETNPPSDDAPRRVTLNPTGAGEFKAIGSIDPAKLEQERERTRDIDAEAEREARPMRDLPTPRQQSTVEVPLEQELDAALEAEIIAAMGGATPDVEAAVATVTTPATDAPAEDSLHQGKRLKGKVALIHGEDMFLDLGFRSQGILPLKQYEGKEVPAVGTVIDVVVQKVSPEEGLIHVNIPSGRQKVQGNWDAVQAGLVVDCMVTKTNKGGLEITVSSLRGFMPSGQVALHFVENLEQFVGQKMTVKILEANKSKRNLIVSRRALLLEERAEAEEKILSTLEVGQTLDGTVKTVKDYGAFVDLGGLDGFIHIGQMSWQHIKHPSEVLAEGQAVKVKVISISDDKKKIGLSVKQTSSSPWDLAASKYFQGQTVSGKVTRTTDFGAFVELEPGVEGMVHISELDHKRVIRVSDVVSVGQTLELQVQSVDPVKHRISLSLKALRAKPDPAAPPREEAAPEQPAAPPPKRKTPLKGGREREEPRGGGLFGNPSDFK
ncbi:MAG: small subunit ribosomal protein S1, partial [Planctomycetota bacterium]